MLEQKKGTRMPVKSAVGSAAAMREVLEAAYSGTAGIHPGIRRSADPTTDRVSRTWLSQTRTTEPGSRDDHGCFRNQVLVASR